jgi:putative aldouronate transport system substrate-binding protein
MLSSPLHGVDMSSVLIKSGSWIGDFGVVGYASSFDLAAAPLPRREESPFLGSFIAPVYRGPRSASISATSTNKVEATRWLDFGYSEEGQRLYTFGIENETYTIVRKNLQFTEDASRNLRTHFEAGWTGGSWFFRYARGSLGGPYVCSQAFENAYNEVRGLDSALETGRFGDGSQINPLWVFNHYQELEHTFDEVMDGIEQYHLRQFIAFVTGQRDLWEFPDYVDTIRIMGINQAKNALQEAWDRFYAKPLYRAVRSF